jgi:hypothetical protein
MYFMWYVDRQVWKMFFHVTSRHGPIGRNPSSNHSCCPRLSATGVHTSGFPPCRPLHINQKHSCHYWWCTDNLMQTPRSSFKYVIWLTDIVELTPHVYTGEPLYMAAFQYL